MQNFFENLFHYNQTVNEQLADIIKENDNIDLHKASSLYNHILLVHRSWNNRMMGNEGLVNFWQPLDKILWQSYNTANTTQSLHILRNTSLMDQFKYKNSKGTMFSNSFADGCFHIINHSSHHRGQLNSELRSVGMEPIIADYIFYKR